MNIRRAAVAMIVNDQEEILILQRGQQSRYEPGKWELCGGLVEKGETFEQAIRREVKEELDCEVVIEKELIHDTYPDMGDGVTWETVVFRVRNLSEPRVQEMGKCVGLRWVSRDELVGMYDLLASHLQQDVRTLGFVN